MHGDGFALLEKLDRAEGEAKQELLKRIDQCAWFARIDKQVEVILFKDLMLENQRKPEKERMYAEGFSVYLLSRLLDKI